MKEAFDRLVDWYMSMSEQPMFQLAQGLVLGLVIAGAVWMLCRACEKDEFDAPTLTRNDGISESTEGNRDESI